MAPASAVSSTVRYTDCRHLELLTSCVCVLGGGHGCCLPLGGRIELLTDENVTRADCSQGGGNTSSDVAKSRASVKGVR